MKPHHFQLIDQFDIAVCLTLSITLIASSLRVGVPLVSSIQILLAVIFYRVPFYFMSFVRVAEPRLDDSVFQVMIVA
jgi:hypothetical protein